MGRAGPRRRIPRPTGTLDVIIDVPRRQDGSRGTHWVMSTITETRQVRGQVELADPASVAGSRYANPELLPVPLSKRTWNTYNYVAIWMGMAHAISSYLLASGLIVLGMSWLQAFLTITVA